ncbi:MAG: discoidin domain-containing protein, partial [Clostridia bacterium]|nr:discoidin domain-containing protein [Clostridia bacterium]
EEDVAFDIPVIEEVTEEELEEDYVEIFGDEVELMESTVAVHDFEITDDDGVTYLTEIDGVKISFTGHSEATIASIGNGKYTTGTWGGADTNANNKFYWYDGNNAEGFMGLPTTKANSTTITVDFGEPKTFSGIKVYDSVRSRSLVAGGARDIKTINMQVSNDNLFKWYALDAITRTDAGTTEVGTFPFMAGGTAVNVTARYLKFTVSGVHTWGEFELEELVMIDPVEANATKVMDTDIKVNVDMPAALTAAEKEGVTMLSADTAKVVFKGNGSNAEVLNEKPAVIDGQRSGWGDWGLNTSAPTDRYFTVELTNPAAFTGVRVWMHIINASWANGYFSGDKSQNGKVQRIPETAKAMISDDGINWEPVTIEISRNDTYWYLDMPFAFDGAAKNFTAKYIRVYPTKIINGWGEWEVGEVALLNTNAELDTYESVKEISDEVEGRYDYYRAGKFFSYKSGAGTPVVYNGVTYTNTGDWNPVDRLFDGDLSGTSYYHTAANIPVNNDGNAPYVPLPKEIRTITITFNEATQIGGFRVYPRTDNTGGNPYRVNVYASNDGENYTLVRNTAKVFSSTDKDPKRVVLEKGLPAYKYYKFEVYSTAGGGSSTAHTCYSELQVLKPSTFGLDLTEGDFIPYPAGAVKAYTVDKDGKATLFRAAEDSFVAIDGVIVNQALLDQAVAAGESQYAFQLSHDFKIGGCIPATDANKDKYTAESAYIVYDLGSVQAFSGVRIYGRTGQGKQVQTGWMLMQSIQVHPL